MIQKSLSFLLVLWLTASFNTEAFTLFAPTSSKNTAALSMSTRTQSSYNTGYSSTQSGYGFQAPVEPSTQNKMVPYNPNQGVHADNQRPGQLAYQNSSDRNQRLASNQYYQNNNQGQNPGYPMARSNVDNRERRNNYDIQNYGRDYDFGRYAGMGYGYGMGYGGYGAFSNGYMSPWSPYNAYGFWSPWMYGYGYGGWGWGGPYSYYNYMNYHPWYGRGYGTNYVGYVGGYY